jgi:hypothetical protein
MRLRFWIAAALVAAAMPVAGEEAEYGAVTLTGLARDSWSLNPNSYRQVGMVCNVNGPDGFLAIRAGPGSDFAANRKLKRLAIVEVVPSERHGRWVRVVHAYRTVTEQGVSQSVRQLPVEGWTHDGYLCDFIH